MKFTSLKAFLKPGTKFYHGDCLWEVNNVIWDSNGTPLKWWGSCKLRDGGYKPTGVVNCDLKDDAYNWATIIRIGGTPLKLEDLI